MEHDEIYLIDLWRTVIREWKWFVAFLALVLAGTFALTHFAERQWEATAWIQLGRIGEAPTGQDPQVEPLQRVLERLQLRPFQDQVMASLGISPDAPEAGLYRKSLRLEPLPYAGPLVRLSVRGMSPEQARQFAQATVQQLQAVHRQMQAQALQIAHTRLDEIDSDLRAAIAERGQLQRAADAVGRDGQTPLMAGVLLASKQEGIRELQRTRSELIERLGSRYTYETALAWPVYVPRNQAFPNVMLSWCAGLLAGLVLGAVAAIARSARRRAAVSRVRHPPFHATKA